MRRADSGYDPEFALFIFMKELLGMTIVPEAVARLRDDKTEIPSG